ncbi:hypothetical protein PO909_025831 [Leuciscus waleckii]
MVHYPAGSSQQRMGTWWSRGVFCCCSPSASRLCVLWLHKCFATYLGCNEWLFQSKLLFYQLESVGPFFSDL